MVPTRRVLGSCLDSVLPEVEDGENFKTPTSIPFLALKVRDILHKHTEQGEPHLHHLLTTGLWTSYLASLNLNIFIGNKNFQGAWS